MGKTWRQEKAGLSGALGPEPGPLNLSLLSLAMPTLVSWRQQPCRRDCCPEHLPGAEQKREQVLDSSPDSATVWDGWLCEPPPYLSLSVNWATGLSIQGWVHGSPAWH